MPNTTPELGLAIAVDSDDTATYLETNLGGSLTTVDSLFNAASGHTHSGAHQGGPITAAGVADGSITNQKLGPDVARANLLTNGGFEIWQRGTGPITSSYGPDRWQLVPGGGSTVSVSAVGAPNNAGWAMQMAYTHSAASAVQQVFKLNGQEWAWMMGKTVTFAVTVLSSVANAVRLELADGSQNVFSSYHPGNGTWTRLSATITIGTAATVLQTRIDLAASGTFQADDAMLVVGSQPANYVPLHPADDLARCLRYYEIMGQIGGAVVTQWSAAAAHSDTRWLVFKVEKPVTATVTKMGTWTVNGCNQPAVNGPTTRGCYISSVASAAGNPYYQCADTSCGLIFEANP